RLVKRPELAARPAVASLRSDPARTPSGTAPFGEHSLCTAHPEIDNGSNLPPGVPSPVRRARPAPEMGTREPRAMKQRVVIVGAGFAGMNCAKRLGSKAGVDVVVIDRRNHHLFQPL